MCSYTKPKFFWCSSHAVHTRNVFSQFIGSPGNMCIPSDRIIRHPNTEQILVAFTVPKPAAHLHECIVHLCITVKITDHQSFEGKASRQCKSSNSNYAQSSVTILSIIQLACTPLVDRPHFNRTNCAQQIFLLDIFPFDSKL